MADAPKLKVEVATPNGLALEIEADSVEAQSIDGQFGVFPGHVPLLAALRCGLLQVHQGREVQVMATGPGFVEVEPYRVLILTDEFARPEKIDPEAVQQELAKANERLKALVSEEEGPEHHELRRTIGWCHARLSAHEIANRI